MRGDHAVAGISIVNLWGFWKPFGVVELQHFSDLHALDDVRLFQGQVEHQLKTHHEQPDRSIYTVI